MSYELWGKGCKENHVSLDPFVPSRSRPRVENNEAKLLFDKLPLLGAAQRLIPSERGGRELR